MLAAAGADFRIERIQAARCDTHQHLTVRRIWPCQFGRFEGAVVAVENEGVHRHDDFLSG